MELDYTMKHSLLVFLMAAAIAAVHAQTPAKPATAPAAAPATAVKPAVHAVAGPSPSVAASIKAPAGIPQYKGLQKPIFTIALRYQEIKVGTGAVAEQGKLLKVQYTGYRAADGVKFDSSYDHPGPPVRDKDGKLVMGDDGKPKMGESQPFPFHQGVGGTVPGFDQGFAGMKVGGKRRLFIPWQLAYGTKSLPDRGAEHPGIPAKSDLIFDVELLDVADAPPPPQMHPPMGTMPGGHPMPGANAPHPGMPVPPNPPPVTPAAPATPPTAGQPAAPATAPAPATTVTPAPPTPPATTATPAPATPPTTTAPPPPHQ
jgi:peptidylprolyl isomerase